MAWRLARRPTPYDQCQELLRGFESFDLPGDRAFDVEANGCNSEVWTRSSVGAVRIENEGRAVNIDGQYAAVAKGASGNYLGILSENVIEDCSLKRL